MPRPITLFTGQWADLPFEEVARLASEWGYDGLEIGVGGDHLDTKLADEEPGYLKEKLELLKRYDLKVYAISNHLTGQAVCDDPIDFRHQAIVRPYKVTFPCPQCGLSRHEADAVHCKACGHVLNIPDEGA